MELNKMMKKKRKNYRKVIVWLICNIIMSKKIQIGNFVFFGLTINDCQSFRNQIPFSNLQ